MHKILAVAAKPARLVIGLMSGTSADGIDAALVRIEGAGAAAKVTLLAFATTPYPAEVRRDLFRAFEGGSSELVCALNFAVGEAFAAAAAGLCAQAGLPLSQVDLIGSHGQTLWHRPLPPRSTLQVGEGAVIAERTGILTICDFRVRDVAAGGHGAPLVPYADWVLFRDEKVGRAVQNIGGIANVTYLPPGGGLEDVIAFDTGPGNMVMDALAGLISGGTLHYDEGGALAARGKVDWKLLAELMEHPFVRAIPPKTTGREEFGAQFARDLWKQHVEGRGMDPHDLLATVTRFTARSIAWNHYWFCRLKGPVDEVIVGGGGAENPTLMAMLAEEHSYNRIPVRRMEECGLPAAAREAVAFAILANDALLGHPTAVPGATGAQAARVLGKVVLP